jgi:hypothetical protein
MRFFAGTASALLALAAASCALILDFDDLTKGDGSDSGATCTSDLACDDGVACTEDRCVAGACNSTPRALVRIGERRTISGEIGRAFRLSMTATGKRFYLSVFYDTPDSVSEVSLHYWDVEGDDYREIPKLSQLTSGPVLSKPASRAALVATTSAPPVIHAYLAAGEPAAVYHLELDGDLTLDDQRSRPAEQTPSFDASLETRGPIAWQTKDDKVWGGWITTSGAILLHSGATPLDKAPTPDFSPSPPPSLIAPLAGGAVPGVLWHSSAGVFGQLQNVSVPSPLVQCNESGTALSLSSASLEFSDGYLAVWTREQNPSGPTVLESALIQCLDTGACAQAPPDCNGPNPPTRAGNRNAALAFYQRVSKPESGYQFAALPAVEGQEASLSLRLRELVVGQEASATELELREIARTPLGALANGPNWPEVAVAKEDVVSVAWIEPADAREVVHWERYRVCYPD